MSLLRRFWKNSGEWQGVQTGIPNASTPQLFAYRTDLLPDGLPDTWEEYREVAKELTDKDKGMYGISVSATTGQLGGVFDYILWSMGGAWADEDWNVTIDSQETRDALNHLKEIQDYADPSICHGEQKSQSKHSLMEMQQSVKHGQHLDWFRRQMMSHSLRLLENGH